MVRVRPGYRKSNYIKKRHDKDALEDKWKFIDERSVPAKKETVQDFLKRGGEIKKYAYKWPPEWKKTFNGFSKYDKRTGKIK